MSQHIALIVPGLGDVDDMVYYATRFWRRSGLEPIVHRIGWYEQGVDFSSKLQEIIRRIDHLYAAGNTVSLIGLSAGASAVLNAYLQRKASVKNVVAVCGRLRKGEKGQIYGFYKSTETSMQYRQSVLLFEDNESGLCKCDRRNIMTVHARFGDSHAPLNTAILEYALNRVLPTGGHTVSIALALTVLAKPLLDFIHNTG